MPNSVNSQTTDAITLVNVKVLGEAPAQAMAVVYQVMATAISHSMQNATANQQAVQQIETAVVGTVCAKIVAMAPSS